jgi:hypothetical protein
MRPAIGIAVMMALGCLTPPADADADAADAPRARTLILAHYMPWFASKPVSGRWGWHWTMNHFDPDRSGRQGRRDIAARDYPLIGPYDSSDPDVLEYHALLMRLAGIDGVVVDWYGSEDVNDYAMIHRRTKRLFEVLARRGLKFAVCYEDRVLRLMAERGQWSPIQVVQHASAHLRFCAEHWFHRPSYVTVDGKPLLLVFGPEYLSAPLWRAALAALRPAPAFFTLHERRDPAVGAFAWPPMWAAENGVLTAKALDGYLDRFAQQDGTKIGCAFPGFDDIYKEAGIEPLHRYLDSRGGKTFDHTLNRALAVGGPVVQIATWNDFGEATTVEPARGYEYRYLETIQAARRGLQEEAFPYHADDLRLPLRIYELRKRTGRPGPEAEALDEVINLLHSGDARGAAARLEALEARAKAPAGPK